jgi:hypothetical protein
MRRLSVVAQKSPGTIALCTIEIAAVNPDGLERRERLMDAYGALIDECLGTAGEERSPLPPTLARAMAGSIHRTIDAQLRSDHSAEQPVQ